MTSSEPQIQPSTRTVFFRRFGLIALIAVPTYVATGYMAIVLPHGGKTIMEVIVLIMFAVLYAWISIGFWTAMVGWWILMRGSDRYAISNICNGNESASLGADVRTAVVMPVYDEAADRVELCLAATIDSLLRTGAAGHFDFFILSDPGDPDIWVQEEMAWANLRRRYKDAPCRIYYRRRRSNAGRKSGNIADFCRKWGKRYRYMVVLDADSVMRGTTLVRMVRIMECRHQIGILQTAPQIVNRETLIARTQQFAGSLYGRMFAAGLNFWQLGDAQFWGHNAIIRLEPFMAHCALPKLSGSPPLGGDILSHDFVESALMRRAGYEVWLTYLLEGSYEEPPPTLLDELKRDRRWCQGNMQHMRLLFTRGLYGTHRVLFLNGAMVYGSALLWFLFLAASTVLAILQNLIEPDYFPSGRSLFPQWPVWEPQWAIVLLASTAVILFLPKICALFYALVWQRRAGLYGGPLKLVSSFFLEIVISTLLAPVRMLFHAKFVFATLIGRAISWKSQQRGDEGTGWAEAVRFHLGGTLFALVWGASVFLINRDFFWWLSPILISLLIAIPLSVWLSRRSAGLAFWRRGLLLTPEESAPPVELRAVREAQFDRDAAGVWDPASGDFILAVTDPRIYSLHRGIVNGRKRPSASDAAHLSACCEKALSEGPHVLTADEKKGILSDPASLQYLHEKVWELSDPGLSRAWRLP